MNQAILKRRPGGRRFVLAALASALLAACGVGGPTGPNAGALMATEPAPKLSDYRLFKDAQGRTPAEGVLAYDLVNALFSDYAAKHRYVYVPGGAKIDYRDQGALNFPVGSVLIKTFAFAPDMRKPAEGERLVETRLLIHKANGWVAYPYIWNAEGTEAVYSAVGGRKAIETITPDGRALKIDYQIPNRNQCKACHQWAKTMTPIGPKARNLNHVGPAGANQIADWTNRGILAGAPPVDKTPAVPAAFDPSQPREPRARAWLDINCAHCHNAVGAASNSGLFLDWNEAEPVGWGVHKRPVAAGRGSGNLNFVIEPGHPEASILVHRLEATEPGVLMPELGRTVVDARGVELMRAWIGAMPARN